MDAFIPKFLGSIFTDNPLPDGVNKWDEPLNGRVPVVLIHGTWLNAYNTWDYLAPELIKAGHAVFAFNYGKDPNCFVGKASGVYACGYLRRSHREVAQFIDEVIERTGADQVDLVGHSQGVAQARLFLSDSGGSNADDPTKNRVRKLIGIGPASHGTTLSGISTIAGKLDPSNKVHGLLEKILGGAAIDQRLGSEFGEYLNQNGDTVPGVDYTLITTTFDGIATPWQDQVFEAGEGATVNNVHLQDGGSRLDFSSHLSMLYSPRVVDIVLEALDPQDRTFRRPRILPMLGELNLPKLPLSRLSRLSRSSRRRR